jgi:hypothetical protein
MSAKNADGVVRARNSQIESGRQSVVMIGKDDIREWSGYVRSADRRYHRSIWRCLRDGWPNAQRAQLCSRREIFKGRPVHQELCNSISMAPGSSGLVAVGPFPPGHQNDGLIGRVHADLMRLDSPHRAERAPPYFFRFAVWCRVEAAMRLKPKKNGLRALGRFAIPGLPRFIQAARERQLLSRPTAPSSWDIFSP